MPLEPLEPLTPNWESVSVKDGNVVIKVTGTENRLSIPIGEALEMANNLAATKPDDSRAEMILGAVEGCIPKYF